MKYMSHIISTVTHKLHPKIGEFYNKFWNPVNYAIIGGTGILINMTILLPASTILPLWIANLIAIFCAWTWNWTMSVGPFGWIWGFKEKQT